VVIDRTWVGQNTSHQVLEPRSAMAYWQNGKLFLHAGTQSTVQTVPSIARWVGIDQKNIVLISEYTGGGFRQPDSRLHRDGDSVAAVEEGERAGDDAHRA
jgi:CO/xanthine dehydrogenase Mo-binding subunit